MVKGKKMEEKKGWTDGEQEGGVKDRMMEDNEAQLKIGGISEGF